MSGFRNNQQYRTLKRINKQTPEEEPPNNIISVLLHIFSVITILFFIFLLIIRTLGVGHVIRNTDITGILEGIVDEENTHYIINQINNLDFHDIQFELSDIEEFLQLDAVSNEIGNIVDGYATAFILGDHEHHITTDDIVNMAKNLEPEFSDFFNHQLTDSDIEHLAQTLDDIMDFNSMSIDILMEDFDVDLSIPMTLLSPVLIWFIGFLCLMFLGLIFIINKEIPAKASLCVGIPLTVSGLLAFVSGLFLEANPGVLGEAGLRFYRYIEAPVKLLESYGFAFTAVGIVIMIVSYMFLKASKSSGA